jgi:hypothetical protein
LSASAAGWAVLSAAQASGQHEHEAAHHHDKLHADCLKACSDCDKVCDETFHHCYMKVAEGQRDHAKPLHLLSDCAGFCGLAACMIAKHSSLMASSCNACAEACQTTAAECERFDSPEMKNAARTLRDCERSCREMVASMRGRRSAAETVPGRTR